MNLSYLFKMRFIVFFTYFTFLLQKTILCNIFLLHSTKKTPPSKESDVTNLKKYGSIISVVGKTTVEIIELFECRQKVP